MALFKVNRGNSSNLPVSMTDGWAYFCTDTAEFFIDYADSNGVLHRKPINSKNAETLSGASLAQILNANELEIPSSKAVFDALNTNSDFFIDITDDKICDKTSAEINAAYTGGRVLKARYQGMVYYLNYYDDRKEQYVFTNIFNSNTDGNVIIGGKVFVTTNYETPVVEYGLINEFFTPQSSTNLNTTKKNVIQAINEVNNKASTQADWFVNDTTSQAYVKNRPFYESDPVITTLIENQTISFTNEFANIYIAQVNAEFELNANATYKIVWDNVEYNLQTQGDVDSLFIGDIAIIEGASTDGQPPFFMSVEEEILVIGTLSTSQSHTVSITCYQTEIITLPSKFLSDDVFTIDNFLNVNYTAGKTVKAEYGNGEIFNDYTNNKATGSNSHAEGYATEATNYNAHAEGSGTIASGHTSHAEGSTTTASGQASHAQGYKTKATGWNTHAEGQDTEAVGRSQHVQGEYNILDTSSGVSQRGRYAHIVGNGNSANARSNAHTLDWSGNAWFKGEIKVGGTGQDDANAKTLATVEALADATTWIQIYDSGAITSEVNAFANIDVSDYKNIMVAIKCVNTTNSASNIGGAVVFTGENGKSYAFNNILNNLIKNSAGTSGAMAIFKVINGFIVCENAMRAVNADNMLSNTEGLGADNLTPLGGGIVKCTSPVSKLVVSTANQSTSHYYGVGSRVIVWGCK